MDALVIGLGIVAAIGLIVAAVIFMPKKGDQPKGQQQQRLSPKDNPVLIKRAKRRLAQNPKDPSALETLADASYESQDFQQASRLYDKLIELCAMIPDLNEFEFTRRHALSLLHLRQYEDAYRGLMIARSMHEDDFEINYQLGHIEFRRRNFPRAVSFLRIAQNANPDHAATTRLLGLGLYHSKQYAKAVVELNKAAESAPNDKEVLFALAQSCHRSKKTDIALRLFTQLRTDPQMGPRACLASGSIHLTFGDLPQAVADFELGLQHAEVNDTTTLELKYRLAAAFLKQRNLTDAIDCWRQIAEQDPGFRDVSSLIQKYAEINVNRHLEAYLVSSSGEFVNLCRQIVDRFFTGQRVKILNVALRKNEYVDILAHASMREGDEHILFRFIRSTGVSSDMVLREQHARLKEVHASRGVCATAGRFSDAAKAFVEARLIDLLEKDDLLRQFKKLSVEGA